MWKGTLAVADLEQVDKKKDASEFHNVKLNAKEMTSENSNLDHPSSRRSSRRPSWRIRRVSTTDQSKKSLHINPVYTEISDILTKIASKKIFGKTCHEFLQQGRFRPSITGKTSCYRGTGFFDDVFLVKLVWYITSNIITSGKVQAQQTISALLNVRVQTSKYGETRHVTQPIKQCRRKRVSKQKLRVHDKYGETRYLSFF